MAMQLLTRPAAERVVASTIAQRSDWHSLSIQEFESNVELLPAALASELAVQVRRLTGVALPLDAVTVDTARRAASVSLDGTLFRLRHGEVVVVRPCAHCGVGEFESDPLRSRFDLGYALVGWEPRHVGCEIEDLADW